MDLKTYQTLTQQGVKILQRETVYIQDTVKIGRNTTIEPFCVLLGKTEIEENCIIGSFSYLKDAKVKSGAQVDAVRITDSSVGEHSIVGPFARLRQDAEVKDFCKVGNFVEIKNSTLGSGSKASHLTYVGDATIGKNCNVGCGTIFVNYDGKNKHHTLVGDDVFLGCNSNLIAPLKVADGTFVACGTTVTKNTNQDDFIIGRSRETVKPKLAKKYLGGQK